jgi:hypothetical protein
MALTEQQRRVLRELKAAPSYRRAPTIVKKALIEAGLVESNLSTPSQAASDRDSEGALQQRPSTGWGPTTESNTTDAEQFLRRAIPLAGKYSSSGQIAQAVQRSAFPGRYNQRGGEAQSLLGGGGGGLSGGSTTTQIPGQTITTQIPTVDKAGFEQARKLAIVGGLIAKRNPNSFLLRSGLLSTQEPTLSNFMGSRTVKDVIPGATVRTPAGQAGSMSVPQVGGGRVAIAKGADRPGVSTQPIVKSFIAQVAGHAKRPITIGTGTNHNQMTTSGNVSDHWTGHAADLPQPVDSHQGDMVAAHALQVAGVPWSQAVRMAQKGGVFNVTPKSGPYKGHRVQVLWKTMVGGNHHNHVHVGIR